MPKDISIEEYFAQHMDLPLVDVRSPGEFEKGHIPGAINIPLFSNEERAHVGTVYKQQSKEDAIALGYEYVNPKLQYFIDESLKAAHSKKLVIHCWRGGMRSHSFGQHLKDNGFHQVYILDKGYKAYRTLAVNNYDSGSLKVLGGYTGSGKTYILKELRNRGCQVIDLEGLAHHKGSAFGRIGMKPQPTTEQFENNLYWEWRTLDFSQPVWIEDESPNIGDVNLPQLLFQRIRSSKLLFLEISREERAKLLVKDYVLGDKSQLANSIQRISKRLGPQNTKEALTLLEEDDFYQVALIALKYYDKFYQKGMGKRDQSKITKIKLESTSPEKNAEILIKHYND